MSETPEEKPVWNTATMGDIPDDERENYRVVTEDDPDAGNEPE